MIAAGQVHVEASGRVAQGIDRLLKRVPLRADPPVLQERVDEARIGITQLLGEHREVNTQTAVTLKRADGKVEEGVAGLAGLGDLAAAVNAETARRAMLNVVWGLAGCAVLYPLAAFADAASQPRRGPLVR